MYSLQLYSGPIRLHGQVLSDTGEALPNTLVHFRIGYLSHPFTAANYIEKALSTDESGEFDIRTDHLLTTSIRFELRNPNCTFPSGGGSKYQYNVPLKYGWGPLFSSQQVGSMAKPSLYQAASCKHLDFAASASNFTEKQP